jgi:hypothetical protein
MNCSRDEIEQCVSLINNYLICGNICYYYQLTVLFPYVVSKYGFDMSSALYNVQDGSLADCLNIMKKTNIKKCLYYEKVHQFDEDYRVTMRIKKNKKLYDVIIYEYITAKKNLVNLPEENISNIANIDIHCYVDDLNDFIELITLTNNINKIKNFTYESRGYKIKKRNNLLTINENININYLALENEIESNRKIFSRLFTLEVINLKIITDNYTIIGYNFPSNLQKLIIQPIIKMNNEYFEINIKDKIPFNCSLIIEHTNSYSAFLTDISTISEQKIFIHDYVGNLTVNPKLSKLYKKKIMNIIKMNIFKIFKENEEKIEKKEKKLNYRYSFEIFVMSYPCKLCNYKYASRTRYKQHMKFCHRYLHYM